MSKALKALMRKTSGYALYDADNNVLIGIVGCSTDEDSKEIDITEKVRTMVQEHFVAESAVLHSLPDFILHPDMGVTKEFGATTIENEESFEYALEICPVTIY